MLITLIEASERLGVSPWRLGKLALDDKLPVVSVNGYLMAEEEDIVALMEPRPVSLNGEPQPRSP